MHTAQDVIKAAISTLHGRHLKSLGFRKSGSTWDRTLKWSQVINIQLLSSNSSTEAKLTLNFGVFIEDIHQATGSPPLKGNLKEYDCDVQSRIGSLHSDGQDYWWTVVPSANAEELADGLFAEIRDYGLPWFDRLSTLDGLAEEFIAKKSPFKAAIAFHLAGKSNEAALAMVQAYAESNQHFRPKLTRIAKSLAIPIHG